MMTEPRTITIEFDERNILPVYRPLLDDETTQVYLLMGGAGSGKSHFMAFKFIYNCLTKEYFRGLYCRKVGRTIRNSQFLLFKDIIDKYNLNKLFRILEGTMEIECIVNGNKLIAAGIDNVEKIKSITDVNAIWLEEASEFLATDYEQLILRMRKQGVVNQIYLTFNPVPCWLLDYFYINGEGIVDADLKAKGNINYSYKLVHTTYKDNYFLPSEYTSKLEGLAKQNRSMYRIYAEGKPSMWFNEQVFSFNQDYFTINSEFEGDIKVYGVDFGYTNPTAIVQCNILAKEKKVYIKEILYKSKLTNSELITFMKNNLETGRYIFCDTAEPQRIEELKRAGLLILAPKKDIIRGLQILKEYKLYVSSDSSNLLKEMRQYTYAKDSKGTTTELPVKLNDHLIDAMRYAVNGAHNLLNKKVSEPVIVKFKR
jgi:phage terminase large subunit